MLLVIRVRFDNIVHNCVVLNIFPVESVFPILSISVCIDLILRCVFIR